MKKAKLVMIGLDGGTFKIIDPLIEQGKLPNLARLIKEGTRTILKSTIPPLTAPAWVSLMTGVNPGKHGLFHFRKLEKITYNTPFNPKPKETYDLMHSRYYTGKTIWDIFGKMGLKVSVLMMPMTYPAWEINGYMLSGFPSPNFMDPSGYPLEWVATIGPLFDMSVVKIKNEDKLIEGCYKLVKRVGDVLIKQLENDECDIYSIVFSSTDFLQHYLWKYLSGQNSKHSNAIGDIYIEIDKYIGKILSLADNNKCTFVILSDHGFMSVSVNYFHTNAWLIKEGYLMSKEKKILNKTLDFFLSPLRYQKVKLRLLLKSYFKYFPVSIQRKISDKYYSTEQFVWQETKAFRYRIGLTEGIAINLKDRQPFGIVKETEYEMLRDEIIKKLKDFRDKENGRSVIKEIYKREEIYKGKFIDLVPDIIFMLNSEYRGGVGVNKNNIIEVVPKESIEAISGTHDRDGILILSGPKFKKNFKISHVDIIDIFPTILYDLGISLPRYVDGRVIKEAFKDEFSSLAINYTEEVSYETDLTTNLSADEEEVMKKSLKNLGYL